MLLRVAFLRFPRVLDPVLEASSGTSTKFGETDHAFTTLYSSCSSPSSVSDRRSALAIIGHNHLLLPPPFLGH